MATALKLDLEPGTDIAVQVERDHSIVLFDTEKFDVWYEKLKANAPTDADVSTKKGRDTLRSYAADIRSQKAAIDRDRLRLTKEWRDMTSQVNDAGKVINERLDKLADEIRQPLTEYEEAEKVRVAECRAVIDGLKAAAVVTMEDTASDVRDRGMSVWSTKIDPDRFGDMTGEAEAAKGIAVETLKAALTRLTKEEEDRAELAKLRAAEEERTRIEEEKAAAAEIERKIADAARIEEERKAAAEKEEADRIAQAARDAEQKARDEAAAELEAAESKRRYARQIIEHIKQVGLGMIGGQPYPYGILLHELTDKIVINDDLGDMQGEVAAIRDATLATVNAAMERDAERAKRDEEAAEKQRLADEQAARDADKAHRSAVMKAAKEAIMTCGTDEETAKKIVLLIRSGEVPNVTLRF
jgi:colicin import membrane protein